jgi:predicted nucleotidyltransferase
MTTPPIDVSALQWHLIQAILRKHVPDREIWAFGSRAKRTARTYSDLDLAIITEAPLPFAVTGALAEDFSESDLPFRVDIIDWASTQDYFRRIVEQEKVVIQPRPPHDPP